MRIYARVVVTYRANSPFYTCLNTSYSLLNLMKQFVGDVKDGDAVSSYFALIDKKPPRDYKNKPGVWFEMTLSDKTGQITARFWGDGNNVRTRQLFDSLSVGSVVSVQGNASSFYDTLMISINSGIGNLSTISEYDKDDLLPVSDINIPQLKSQLMEEIKSIQNNPLKSLLNSFFKDESFLEKYARWPAARSFHHGYVGGLLEHTINMISLSKTIHKNYPSLDIDIIKAGCILHDIGKVKQYDMDLGITFTSDGTYVGHISLGAMMVKEKIKNLQNQDVQFGEDLERHILHIILSHHGKREFGSPITPKTPEAETVHLVDMCDAQINHSVNDNSNNGGIAKNGR